MTTTPLFVFDQATAIIRGRKILPNTSWTVWPEERWAIIGPNGAGKSSLCRVIMGELSVCQGLFKRDPILFGSNKIVLVSFDSQKRLMRRETRKDRSRSYRGIVDEETSVYESLLESMEDSPSQERLAFFSELLHLTPLFQRGIRALSNGEMRKFLIVRGLLRNPHLLILDEPFEGLDLAAREELRLAINQLLKKGIRILLVTHLMHEMPEDITHVLCLKECQVAAQGEKQAILKDALFEKLYTEKRFETEKILPFFEEMAPTFPAPDEIIRVEDVVVKYKEKTILHNLTWTMRRGENWHISGPNGAGKTTLLHLISGNHLQAYSNRIFLFGKRRGSGESVWEIKQHIGLVSAELQAKYDEAITVFQVVLSGFFDSIGIFQKANDHQKEQAHQWLSAFSLEHFTQRLFSQLSQGEQRMALLARAMVKSPHLLIVDEPCQGLDRTNRQLILKWIDFIGMQTATHVLYVSHHPEETLQCITHSLSFLPQKTGRVGYITQALKET